MNQLNSEAEVVNDEHSDVDDEDDDFEDQGQDDEASDEELFEEDEDFNDTLKIEGVQIGEEWLTTQFLLANSEALSQTVAISKHIEEENKEKLNRSDISQSRRPISPFVSGADGNPF